MTMIESISVEEVVAQDAAAMVGRCSAEEIGPFVGTAYGAVMTALQHQGLQPVGPPFVRYGTEGPDGMDESGGAMVFHVTAGFPCSAPASAEGDVVPVTLQAGTAVVAVHVGAWTDMGTAYAAVAEHLAAHGLERAGDPWETYLDGPEVEVHRTVLRQPCRHAD
jgi:effector-binding domain-containing protein